MTAKVKRIAIAKDIAAYNAGLEAPFDEICDRLAEEIGRGLPEAESKVWHGGPVWFLAGNPIAGYWLRKRGVQLLFWSGQSFDEPGLAAEGKFKAAHVHYAQAGDIRVRDLKRWLKKGREIQWDYKNIIKRRGVLVRVETVTLK